MSEKYALLLQNLELRIGYAFDNVDLLSQALTHRSYGPLHNERLEFLGDSILGMIIAKELFDDFPNCPEGDLTRMRSSLVRETTLAQLAREYGIGDVLRLGPGEIKNGGTRRESLIADAVESIIGAMFIDSKQDFPRVRKVVLHWFESRLKTIKPDVNQKDPKSTLQEYLQSLHLSLPIYRIEAISGPENRQTFDISVEIEVDNSRKSFRGKGSSRRRAEQEAASQALDFIHNSVKPITHHPNGAKSPSKMA